MLMKFPKVRHLSTDYSICKAVFTTEMEETEIKCCVPYILILTPSSLPPPLPHLSLCPIETGVYQN